MRFLRLDLIAFGPFTDRSLDFSAGRHGLHLVYGPNEAGKSSALRALRQFLFGIDSRSPDNFVHGYTSLRIGAVLEDNHGQQHHWIRRKGNKDTLRGADDQQVANVAALEAMLGGIDARQFCQRHGLDHCELVEGSRDVLRGGGQLGELLFAAGAGIASLNGVRAKLVEEAEQLFSPRGTKPKINQGIAELREVRGRYRALQLSAETWRKHRDATRQSHRERGEVLQLRLQKQAARGRKQRLLAAVPLVARRAALGEELGRLAGAPRLPDGFASQRSEICMALRKAEESTAESAAELEQLEDKIQGLVVDELVLQEAALIEQLKEQLGAHRKAAKDRPGLDARRRLCEQGAADLLRELGREGSREQTDSWALDRRTRVRVQELGRQRESLLARQEMALRELDQQQRKRAQLAAHLAALGQPLDAADLRQAIRLAARAGDLDSRRAAQRAQLDRLKAELAEAMEKLELGRGSLALLRSPGWPAEETLARFEEELSDRERTWQKQQERCLELDEAIAAADAGWTRQLAGGAPVGEDDLARARALRDQAWGLVRAAWEQDEIDEAAVKQAIQSLAPAGSLAEALTLSMQRADEVADRLRHESRKLAELESLAAERQRLQARRAVIVEEQRRASARLDASQQAWRALWVGRGVEPDSPREMRGWLLRRAELLRLADEVAQRQRELDDADRQAVALVDALQRQLAALNRLPADTLASTPLVEHLAWADEVAGDLERQDEERRQLTEELRGLDLELPRVESQLRAAEAAVKEWTGRWAEAMHQLDLPPQALPSEAESVTGLIAELQGKWKEAGELAERLRGIDEDAERFAEQVARLARSLGIEADPAAVERTVLVLGGRLDEMRNAESRRRELIGSRERERERHDRGSRQAAELGRQLGRLCEEAGAASADELPEIEERSLARQRCERELAQLDDRLVELSGGAPLAELCREAEQVDADAIEPAIRQLDEELRALEEQQLVLSETIGREEAALRAMAGSDDAARADEEAEGLLAGLRSDAEEYARLRLASAVLSRAIERYREKHQGPVLQRASELFSILTGRAFAGLRSDFDDRQQPVLLGVRADGRTAIGVEGMSDGTRDQLYLALRVASLEHGLSQRPPLPLIVDDVLIQFDDARAGSALRVFGQVSDRTQVVFFTHHEHLIEIAREHVEGDRLFVQRLE